MDSSYIRNDFIAGIFDRAAETYSSIGPGYFKCFGEKLIEKLSIYPHSSLLDIACGKGDILFPASEKIGSQGKVIGIDFSHNMVMETQNSIIKNGYPGISVQQMDAEKLLFEDNSFDTVTCGFAIQFFSNYQLALKEMRRVLKPSGKIGITSWKKPEKPPLLARIIPEYLPQNDANPSQPKPEFGLPDTLKEMFVEAGFKDIIVAEESKRFYYKDEDHWWQDQWSHGGRIYLEPIEKMGSEIMEKFKKDVSSELKEITDEKGIYFDAKVLFVIAKK